MKNSAESIIARGISIASKFLLVGYLAKILTLADYGSFQLVSYFVAISTTIYGLEYYNIGNRSIAETENKEGVYTEHLRFFYTLSPLVLVIQVLAFLALFPTELIKPKYVLFVLLISICDYFSQEVYRYLVINKAYRKGNVQLIYKSVFFLVLIALYMVFFNTMFFNDLIGIMVVSYAMLLLFAYYSFKKNLHRFELHVLKFLNWEEIQRILKALWPFLVLVLFIKGIEFLDKFIIAKELGLEETGIYSFLFAMASVLNVFIVSGFYIIYLPQLITSFNTDRAMFKKELTKFSLLTITFSVVLSLMIALGSPYVFSIIGKNELLGHLDLLYTLLIGFVLYNISLIPHLFLYVCHDERNITWIMGIAFVVNLGLNVILIPRMGVSGAGYSFIVTYLLILICKSIRAIIKWKKLAA